VELSWCDHRYFVIMDTNDEQMRGSEMNNDHDEVKESMLDPNISLSTLGRILSVHPEYVNYIGPVPEQYLCDQIENLRYGVSAPLHIAAVMNRADWLCELIDRGANIDEMSVSISALHYISGTPLVTIVICMYASRADSRDSVPDAADVRMQGRKVRSSENTRAARC
jgi:hypothetical protein